MANFAEILIRKKLISPDQLAEAKKLSKESRKPVADELIRLGYATSDDVMRICFSSFRRNSSEICAATPVGIIAMASARAAVRVRLCFKACGSRMLE